MADTIETRSATPVTVEDVPFHRDASGELLARIYRPRGAGPFPVMIDLHGGAWNSGDRTQNVAICEPVAAAGAVVVSLDFRMPPVKRYPETLADINLGIRWAKAHARDFGGRADCVGGFGTSSGGHLIMLAALRPTDPRVTTLPLPGAANVDARLAFVISGWGVLDPLLRYRLAKERGNEGFIKNHDAFWGSEAAMSDGSPPLMLERGETLDLPPALVFQGTDDEWVPQAMVKKFAADYRQAGGTMELEFLPGAKHSYFRDDPDGPNAVRSIALVKDFVLRQAKAKR